MPVLPLLLLCYALEIVAGPVNSNSAFSPHHGDAIWREKFSSLKLSNSTAELKVQRLDSIYIYGFSELLTGIINIPYLNKKMRLSGRSRQVSGFGDVQTLLKYRFFTDDEFGKTHRLAAFIGMEWPTGDDNEHDHLGKIPAPLQLGSGSYDPIGGIVWTKQTFDWEFDADISYKMNNTANNYEFGDMLAYNLSYQHRLWPRDLPDEGVPSFLYAVLEVNGTYIWKDKDYGSTNDNSGGHRLIFSPGLQWLNKSWVMEATMRLPLFEDLNGTALELDYGFTLGLRCRF
ncbi:MAG: transporter [Lentisphaeraceae bacterium]|nr:transporter [Lentisphaeraceae bacterium]